MTPAFPDLVTAMSHPRLFGPMFAGASWDNWRTILKAALGLPMSPGEIAFFRSVTGREPPGHRVKEMDVIAGRRSGKDSVTSAVACYDALALQKAATVQNEQHRQAVAGERSTVGEVMSMCQVPAGTSLCVNGPAL